jgi:hypothetical protein
MPARSPWRASRICLKALLRFFQQGQTENTLRGACLTHSFGNVRDNFVEFQPNLFERITIAKGDRLIF